jgi:hypothetical protein
VPRFVSVDHDTTMLLPPDLRAWVPDDHIVHFIMDAIDALRLDDARVNTRGTGSAQYPPSMRLGLLIYCYATGTFPSARSRCSPMTASPCATSAPSTTPITTAFASSAARKASSWKADRGTRVWDHKGALGFRMFSLRGLSNVSLEWTLMTDQEDGYRGAIAADIGLASHTRCGLIASTTRGVALLNPSLQALIAPR